MAMTGGTAKLVHTGYLNYGSGPAMNLYVYYKHSQDIATNTSTVWVGMYFTITNQYWDIGTWTDFGGSYLGNSSSMGFSYTVPANTKGTRWIVENKSFKVNHNAEGKATATIYWRWGVNSTWGQFSKPSGSFNITLPTIPRQAKLTSAPNFNDEQNPTINYSNPAGSAVSSLQACISLDGSKDDIAYRNISTTGTSYTFNLTTAERNVLRNACATSNSRNVKFFVRTVIGGNTFYSTLDKTLSIVNATPTLSPTVTDVNEGSILLTGDPNTIIKNHNSMQVNSGAATYKGAWITSQKITCGSKSINGGSGTLSSVDSNQFVFTVTDSRGNSASRTITKAFVDYTTLTCNLTAKNPTADGDLAFKISGNYWSGNFGAYQNLLEVRWRYKQNNEEYGEWTEVTPSISGNSYEIIVNLTGLDYQSTYTLQARVYDRVLNIVTPAKSVKTTPIFDWGENDFHIHGDLIVEGTITGNNATAAMSLDDAIDYIIEYGNNGSYAYKKWNSGLMEAWRSAKSTVSVTSSNTAGSMYYTDQVSLTTNGDASQFISLESVQVTVNKNGAIGFWIPVVARTSVSGGAASADVFFVNGTKDSTVAIIPQIHFTGRWK